jgi:DNA polymerase III subunit epsilon
MNWHEGPLATFDLETTSLDPEEARVVSVAFIFLSPNDEVLPGSFSRIVNPEIAIPEEAVAVHGIAQDQVELRGLDRTEIVERIFLSFARAAREEIPVVIYNARYDLTLFLSELRRLTDLTPNIGPIIDPLVIDRVKDKYRKGGRKLEAVATHYGVTLDDAHAASADAIAAAQIARALPLHHRTLLSLSLTDLQDAQAKWHESWKSGLNAWWKRKGIDRRIPEHEVWPTHLEY